jgi:beta-glucosidase
MTNGSGGAVSGAGGSNGTGGGETIITGSGGTADSGTTGAGAGGTSGKMSCGDSTVTLDHSPGYPDAQHQTYLQMATTLRNTLTLTEKAEQMRGVFAGSPTAQYSDIQRSYDNTAKGIKAWRYRDGPRGVNYDAVIASGDARDQVGTTLSQHARSTVYPTPVARGATFDVDLEYRIGQSMGDEALAGGQTILLVPCVNILRHPFWGRSQETYGEDNFLLGRIGTGLVAGVQEYIAACVKHFAANNVEVDRTSVNAQVDSQTLRETFGRHFDMIINDGGVACVMAAYNSVNGTKSTQNSTLLTTILRTEFGFKGFVLSDWWAMPGGQTNSLDAATRRSNAGAALAAGLDLEVPWALNYNVLDSNFTDADLNAHVDRLLEQKFRFKVNSMTGTLGLKAPTTSFANNTGITGNQGHIAIAEEAAEKGMVLLKNCSVANKACTAPEAASVLPINRTATRSIAVIGATLQYCQSGSLPGINNCADDVPNNGTINFATGVRIGDVGSSRVSFDPTKAVSPFAGICTALGGTVSGTTCSGSSIPVTTATTNGSDVSAAVTAAGNADFVVVMAGLTPYDEGEQYNGSGDRTNLALDGKDLGRGYGTVQNTLITQVAALGKPMAVVLQAGSAVDMPWLANVPALVMAWYPGIVGGTALGKLLLGDANFSGKLPITWPASASQLPVFNQDPRGTTTMDYFLGYRRFDQMNLTPLFPFGYGLSYSKFNYSNLQVPCSDITKNGVVNVTVDLQNAGARSGDEVAMLFVSFPTGPTGTPRRSVKELKGFYRVSLAAAGTTGDAKRITIPLRIQDLKYFDSTSNTWQVQTGKYTIMVGPNAGNLPLSDTFTVN